MDPAKKSKYDLENRNAIKRTYPFVEPGETTPSAVPSGLQGSAKLQAEICARHIKTAQAKQAAKAEKAQDRAAEKAAKNFKAAAKGKTAKPKASPKKTRGEAKAKSQSSRKRLQQILQALGRKIHRFLEKTSWVECRA